MTTASGNVRMIALGVLSRCWGPISRDEPVARWKSLSESNSSYVAAIYDDIVELLESSRDRLADSGHGMAVAPETAQLGPELDAYGTVAPPVPIDRGKRGDAHTELETLRIQVGMRDQLILDLQGELRMLRDNLPPALEEGRHREVEEETRYALRLVEAELGATKGALGVAQAELRRFASEVKTMQSRIDAGERIKDRAVERAAAAERGGGSTDAGSTGSADLETARAEARRLASEVKTMQSRIDVAERARERAERRAPETEPIVHTDAAPSPEPRHLVAPIEVHLDVGALRFSSTKHLPIEVAQTLDRSATSVFRNADQAILDSRRALEAIVEQLFARALGRSAHGLRVAEMLSELRGHPSIPDSDWHQAKNLYARASAVVHDRGGTPSLALWIWLGTYQLAELLEVPRPPGTT